jgi:hypothetical protein
MFPMFCLGIFFGAAFLACLIAICTVKPDCFKWSVLLLLMTILATQWIIGYHDQILDKRYHQIGGR